MQAQRYSASTWRGGELPFDQLIAFINLIKRVYRSPLALCLSV